MWVHSYSSRSISTNSSSRLNSPIFIFFHSFHYFLYWVCLGGKTPDVGSRTYSQIMQEQKLKGEENEVRKTIIDKSKDGSLKTNGDSKGTVRKRGRWDQVVQNGDSSGVPAKKKTSSAPWEEVIV